MCLRLRTEVDEPRPPKGRVLGAVNTGWQQGLPFVTLPPLITGTHGEGGLVGPGTSRPALNSTPPSPPAGGKPRKPAETDPHPESLGRD